MVKRTIKETVSEYDENGKLVKQTITETTEDDDTKYWPDAPLYLPSWWNQGPVCECNVGKQE